MTQINRRLSFLPVTVLIGCGSSTTSPSGGAPTTTYYVGALASPFYTGSFTATAVTGSAAPSISITVMTVQGVVFTLSGALAGSTFSVSNGYSLYCSGTATSLLIGTCTLLDGTLSIDLVGTTQANPEPFTIYCGFETPLGGGAPVASVVLGVIGNTSAVGRNALVGGAQTFYQDRTASATSFADTAVASSSGNVFNGTYTSGLASGTDISTSGVIGNWSATTACPNGSFAIVPAGNITFTAPVNATPPSQVFTALPAIVGSLAINPFGGPSWLTATTSGNTFTLSVTPQSSPGTLTTVIRVFAQFGDYEGEEDTVSYIVTGPSGDVRRNASAVR